MAREASTLAQVKPAYEYGWDPESTTNCSLQKRFGTFTHDLLQLADWLEQCGVTHVAMESTGVYWKPVWNTLAEQFEVLLVNAHHIKAVPRRKTDQKGSEWIVDLLQHGLLRGSFVPPRPCRKRTRNSGVLTPEVMGMTPPPFSTATPKSGAHAPTLRMVLQGGNDRARKL